MDIIVKAKNAISSVKKHWKNPPEGRYMPYKEILSLSVGGMGVKFVFYCVNQMIITVGNALIGNTIGIDPTAVYAIYIISVLTNFPLTAIRAKMVDNTRSMKGKYRPYILKMGIPTILFGIGFIWFPYERVGLLAKCAVVLAFNVAFQFFYSFYTDAYDSIINVLSPNSIERSDVISIKSIIENFTPSIANIFLPIVAKLITGQNTLYDIKIYRVLFPPMLVAGFFISMLVYTGTEEKIVQAKTHVIQVRFIDAFKAVAKNKYFWIISLAGWLGFLEGSFNSIIGWLYSYQNACTPGQYSIIVAIGGNASFWPNLIAPFLVRKFGKKKILVYTNLFNIVLIALMLPIVRMTGTPYVIWIMLFITAVNSFMSCFGWLLSMSINADIRDYQQYITGERIDGMFVAVGLIGNVITLATSSVLPVIYEKSGLNKTVAISLGYDGSNVYDVLYNTDYFIQICSVLIIASIVGAIMNVIPYFFYDLSESKQKSIVKVLKIRAMFEDYGNGVLSDEALVETVEIINESLEYADKEPMTGKDKEAKEFNEKIEIAKFVLAELNHFNTEEGKAELELAKTLYEAGLDGFVNAVKISMADAKALPKDTEEQKTRRKYTIALIRDIKSAKKAIAKNFPDGIVEFDSSIFDALFKKEDEIELKANENLKAQKEAKENKDKAKVDALKAELKLINADKKEIQLLIKKATDENSVYYRATKPYMDAKRKLTQSENYAHYDDILKLYAQVNA